MIRRLAALCLALPLAAAAQTPQPAPAAPESAPQPPALAAPPQPPPPPPAPAPPSPASPVGQARRRRCRPRRPRPPRRSRASPSSGRAGSRRTHGGPSAGSNPGGTGSTDLPLFAVQGRDTAGVSARQSRFRAALGLPTDGLLGSASAKGLVELDFMAARVGRQLAPGGAAPSRLGRRHLEGAREPHLHRRPDLVALRRPNFATSLAHLAIPRFAGAGFLYRRAPSSGSRPRPPGRSSSPPSSRALAPYDRPRSSGVLVGERSGFPDAEGRVAVALRPGGRPLLEVGASGRYGREVYFLDGAGKDATVEGWGASVDARLEVPYLTVVGAGFIGDALGAYQSVAPEVTFTTDNAAAPATPRNLAVSPVRSMELLGRRHPHPAPNPPARRRLRHRGAARGGPAPPGDGGEPEPAGLGRRDPLALEPLARLERGDLVPHQHAGPLPAELDPGRGRVAVRVLGRGRYAGTLRWSMTRRAFPAERSSAFGATSSTVMRMPVTAWISRSIRSRSSTICRISSRKSSGRTSTFTTASSIAPGRAISMR